MIKKKKVVQFRDLYSVISELLESYTYEDVAVILERDHDFEIQANTLRHYVYKHKKSLKGKLDNKVSEPEKDTAIENKSLLLEGNDTSTEVEAEAETETKEKPEPPKPKMSADEALAHFKSRQQNKSLFDKK